MRMDGKNTSMLGVWIILSVALLACIGIGLYLIIKHNKHCKPDCTKGNCNDGCGGSCNCDCDTSTGKCKTSSNLSWSQSAKNTANTKLNNLANKNKTKLGLKPAEVIPTNVLSCALETISKKYKSLQDFTNALNNDTSLQTIIQIIKDCMQKVPNPNVCNPGEILIDNKCIPPNWNNTLFNNMLISAFMKKYTIDNKTANCILTKFKNKYRNPQDMIKENDTIMDKLFSQFNNQCNTSCEISDYCLSQGQNASNSMACQEVIDGCMKTSQHINNDDNDCLMELTNKIKNVCKIRKPNPPDSKAVSYCYPNDIKDPNKGCVCKVAASSKDVPDHYFYSDDPICAQQKQCEESISCINHIQLSQGIY